MITSNTNTKMGCDSAEYVAANVHPKIECDSDITAERTGKKGEVRGPS